MMGVQYLYYNVSPIPQKDSFLQESAIPGIASLRKIIGEVRRMLIIPDKQLYLFALGDHIDGFRIDAYGGRQEKDLIMRVYYLPGEKVFDIWDPESVVGSGMPLLGWRDKKLIFKNYSSLLQAIKVENLFSSLIAVV